VNSLNLGKGNLLAFSETFNLQAAPKPRALPTYSREREPTTKCTLRRSERGPRERVKVF
jgi:hypothetical protein